MLVVVGCGDSDSGSSSATGSSTSAASTTASDTTASTPAGGEKVKLEKKKLGFVNVIKASPASSRVEANFTRAAEALGWSVQAIDGQGDPAKMAQGVQSLVNANVDAIATVSVDPA